MYTLLYMLGIVIFTIFNFIMTFYHVIIFLYLDKVHYYVSRETLLHPNLYFVINALLILTYYNKLCCYIIAGNRCNKCFDSYFCTSLNNRELHIELWMTYIIINFSIRYGLLHSRVVTYTIMRVAMATLPDKLMQCEIHIYLSDCIINYYI